MQDKLLIMLSVIFFVLILLGLLLEHTVRKLRQELDIAKYEQERGAIEEAPKLPPPEKVLPGYTMMTIDDYNEIRSELEEKMKLS